MTVGSEAVCPSCGRFTGPYTTCPYCGAQLKQRLSLRVIKIAAILMAVLGLVGLYLYARQVPVPTLSIADAQGTLNMAYVRLQGQVTGNITYDPNTQYLAFWLEDDTGMARISCYRDVTQTLLNTGRIPAVGDRVSVAGTLRVREDSVALTVNVPEHVEIVRPEPVSVPISQLTILDEGLRVRVSGVVEETFVPYEGLTLITLHNDDGSIVVSVPETVVALTGPLPDIAPGQGITVTATVTLYKDQVQLSPASVQDLELGPAPYDVTQTPRELITLSAADEGQVVRVTGEVMAMEGFKGGLKAILDDGTGQVVLLLWDSVYNALPNPPDLDVGARLETLGEVKVYQGELEIVPARAQDVTLLAAAPQLPLRNIGDLTNADAGQVVRLRGVLGAPRGFSAGVKVPLDDGSGRITVLLWSNLATALPKMPEEGQRVEVVGVLSVYNDALEMTPRSIWDWRPLP